MVYMANEISGDDNHFFVFYFATGNSIITEGARRCFEGILILCCAASSSSFDGGGLGSCCMYYSDSIFSMFTFKFNVLIFS